MKKLTTKKIKIMKTFNLYCCFLVLGLCVAVPGPTLIDLTHLVNTSIETIAYIYTARSIGYLCGSLAGGVFFDMVRKKQLILTIFNFVTAVTMIGLPWSRQIITLTVWMVLNGISLGVLDTGGNVCCLNLWGKDSGPIFQGLHFTFGIGGLIAPLVAAPFLGDYSSLNEFSNNSTVFINQTDSETLIENDFLNSSTVTNPYVSEIPPVTFAYASIGGYAFLVTILFFIMSIIAPIDENKEENEESNTNKRSLAFTSIISFLTCMLILTSMGTEVGYAQMLTTYAMKGPLHLSTITGSYMTSAYWAAFTASRLVAIFLAIKFSSLMLIVFDVITTFIGSLALLFLAVHYEWALWMSSVLLGIGIASFFPASVTWVERYITVTNKLASMFTVGAAFGEMLIPYTISHYIDKKPEVFIYVVIASCSLAIFVVLIMYLILRRVPDKYTVKKGISNAAFNNDNKF